MDLQGECRRRETLRSPDDDRKSHSTRYILYQVRGYPRMEICKAVSVIFRHFLTNSGQSIRSLTEVQGGQVYPGTKSPCRRSMRVDSGVACRQAFGTTTQSSVLKHPWPIWNWYHASFVLLPLPSVGRHPVVLASSIFSSLG